MIPRASSKAVYVSTTSASGALNAELLQMRRCPCGGLGELGDQRTVELEWVVDGLVKAPGYRQTIGHWRLLPGMSIIVQRMPDWVQHVWPRPRSRRLSCCRQKASSAW